MFIILSFRLQGTAGNYVDAGLPNLYGFLNTFVEQSMTQSGVYALRVFGNDRAAVGSLGTYRNAVIDFYASQYNAIYGNSTTVQPPALSTQYLIKY